MASRYATLRERLKESKDQRRVFENFRHRRDERRAALAKTDWHALYRAEQRQAWYRITVAFLKSCEKDLRSQKPRPAAQPARQSYSRERTSPKSTKAISSQALDLQEDESAEGGQARPATEHRTASKADEALTARIAGQQRRPSHQNRFQRPGNVARPTKRRVRYIHRTFFRVRRLTQTPEATLDKDEKLAERSKAQQQLSLQGKGRHRRLQKAKDRYYETVYGDIWESFHTSSEGLGDTVSTKPRASGSQICGQETAELLDDVHAYLRGDKQR